MQRGLEEHRQIIDAPAKRCQALRCGDAGPGSVTLATSLAGVNLAAPGAGFLAERFDELLEPLEILLHLSSVHADFRAERLLEPLGLVRHLDRDQRLVVPEPGERHDPVSRAR